MKASTAVRGDSGAPPTPFIPSATVAFASDLPAISRERLSGTDGRTGGRNDQWDGGDTVLGDRVLGEMVLGAGEVPDGSEFAPGTPAEGLAAGAVLGAPSLIQTRMRPFSAAESGGPPWGISPLASFTHSKLDSAAPSRIAGPDSPPASSSAREVTRKPFAGSAPAWQRKQRALKIGKM
jgi:hypothetical protein